MPKLKRKTNESYPDMVRRVVPGLTEEQYDLISQIVKLAWFDGLQFERDQQKSRNHIIT